MRSINRHKLQHVFDEMLRERVGASVSLTAYNGKSRDVILRPDLNSSWLPTTVTSVSCQKKRGGKNLYIR